MATATKKSPKAEAAGNLLSKLHSDAESLFEASEEILMAKAAEGIDYFDPAEIAILRAAGYMDANNHYGLRSIMARASRVHKLKSKAGTPAEYQGAKDALEAAEKAEQEQTPALEQAIRDAELKLDTLKHDRANAAAELAERNTAREELRNKGNLPPHIVSRWQDSIKVVTGDLRYRVAQLQGELEAIDTALDLNPGDLNDRERALNHVTGHGKDLRTGKEYIELDQRKWERHTDELQERRPAVEAELFELREALNEANRQADAERDYYIKSL